LGDQVSLSAPEGGPPQKHGALARLAEWGSGLAMAALDGVAGLGLFLIGPNRLSQEKEKAYRLGQATLAADKEFPQRVASSAFDGLLELMRRPDLPGQTASERLDFVMWYTDSNRDQGLGAWTRLKQVLTHFHPESPFVLAANDRGFAADVADSAKWYNPAATGYVMEVVHGRENQGSPQVGHFLTAVDIGRQNPVLSKLLHSAAVGHELTGDDHGPLEQVLLGLTHRKERALFAAAVKAAAQSQRQKAHQAVERALPELSVNGDEPGRVGNSKQDLLNTSYGMAFGQLVRQGKLETREQAADWLFHNLGAGAKPLPWNEPETPGL
jgi:hypothetical protein